MAGRAVLCVRATAAATPRGRPLIERMRALDARASARGGVLVAWGAARASFAFDPGALGDAVALVSSPGEDTAPGEAPFAAGLAEGDLDLLADDGSRGELAWGRALLVASALASAARPGELACAADVSAVASGALVSVGRVRTRIGAHVVRGVRVPAAQPWREHAAMQLSRMRVPRLVGVDVAALASTAAAGAVTLVRAGPGAGGTRLLQELAAQAPRALLVSPSGSGYEPFGGLRHALARAITPELAPAFAAMAGPLERVLAGDAVDLASAAALLRAFFGAPAVAPAGRRGLLLVDDVKLVDHATLDACVRATRGDGASPPSFALVARLDRSSGVPAALATVPRAAELELPGLSPDLGELVAGGSLGDALTPASRRRWAKLGGALPLGLVEAVSFGVASGRIAWRGERAESVSPAADRGAPRTPGDWIRARAAFLGESAMRVASCVALLGGEASSSRLAAVLARARREVDVERAIEGLVRERWLVDTRAGRVGLPSRTHRDTLAAMLEPEEARALHAAAADVIAAEERAFGRAEGAWHAAQAGQGARAAKVLLDVARGASSALLETSTTHLIALARRADPACEEGALELLSDALARIRSSPAVRARAGTASEKLMAAVGAERDSEPTLARAASPRVAGGSSPPFTPAELPPSAAPPSASGTAMAHRLGDVAKAALVGADTAALERWVGDLRASGDKPVLTERLDAMARLGRGDVGDALRVLRRTRQALAPEDHALRCQTSLALGVALSVAGRPDEALLEGLDALARAREAADPQGTRACLAFLAKLYASVGRAEDAARLRAPR